MIPKSKIHRLPGASVRDRDGASVGKVREVFPADGDGHAAYVSVSTGIFGSDSMVPVEDGSFDGMDVHVSFPKTAITDAPTAPVDHQLTTTEENRVREHYGLSPVGQAIGDMGDPDENPEPPAASDDTEGAGTASNA
jgi:hypothetical protein